MRRLILALAAVGALAGPAAAIPRQALTDFDVTRITGLADQLAVCDLTAWLMTEPNVEADVIYVSDRADTRLWPLRYPYYRPLNVMVDEDLRNTFHSLESRGVLRRQEVAKARTRYDRDMIESYRRSTMTERVFLHDQRRTCDGIMEAALAG